MSLLSVPSDETCKWPLPPVSSRLSQSDLVRLSCYFMDHAEGLANRSLCESPLFVSQELQFQIRALDGDVESMDDGYFTIEVMIKNGSRESSYKPTYFGYSSIIDVAHVKMFCSEIDRICSAVTKPKMT